MLKTSSVKATIVKIALQTELGYLCQYRQLLQTIAYTYNFKQVTDWGKWDAYLQMRKEAGNYSWVLKFEKQNTR